MIDMFTRDGHEKRCLRVAEETESDTINPMAMPQWKQIRGLAVSAAASRRQNLEMHRTKTRCMLARTAAAGRTSEQRSSWIYDYDYPC